MGNTLKVAADYECYPLWIRSNEGLRNIHPYELKLSSGLVEQLMIWANDYDATMNWDDPISSGFRTQSAHDLFVRRGKLLSEEVAKQLDADWKVIYFDDIMQQEIDISTGVD